MKLAALAGVTGLCFSISCVADPPSPTAAGPSSVVDAGSDTGAVSSRKTVFLTRSHPGNLNGGDPDAFCKQEAGGTGEWRAMIARNQIPAPASLDGMTGDYYEVGGSQPLVTLGVPLDGRAASAFDPERGIDGQNVEADVNTIEIWIGNVLAGGMAGKDRCNDWGKTPVVTGTMPTGITWTPSRDQFNVNSPVLCTNAYHVLCFEK